MNSLSRLLLCFVAVATLSTPAGAAPFLVEVERCGSLPAGPVELAAIGGEAASPDSTSLRSWTLGVEQSRATIDLDPEVEWWLTAAAAGAWGAPPVRLSGERSARISLWPLAIAQGRITVPRNEERPTRIELRFRPVEPSAAGAATISGPCEQRGGRSECSIDENGAFRCDLPQGRWNLHFKADGWAGQHRWSVEAESGSPTALGTLSLRRGATLIGEVTTVDGPADPRLARVRVYPAGSTEEEAAAAGQLLTRSVNEQGYFLFEDLKPGTYMVVALQPGLARSRATKVELVENRETALRQPILLGPQHRLTVQVVPEEDAAGRPWEVRLFRERDRADVRVEVDAGFTGGDGSREFVALDAGAYRVQVVDSRRQVLAEEGPVVLDGQETVFLPVELTLIELEGELTLGDEPVVAAELWFGGRDGAVHVEAVTDEEGRFRTLLPRAGDWEVDIFSDSPPIDRRAHGIDVPEEGGRVEIRLPATLVSGRVRTEDGSPPALPARVALIRSDAPGPTASVLEVASDGRFESRGLAAGLYQASASGGEMRSEIVTFLLSESSTPELELILRSRRSVAGRIVDGHGEGVANVSLTAIPRSSSGAILDFYTSSATSDPSGRFEVEVPAGTELLEIEAFPVGYGFTSMRASIEDLTVPVSRAEGTIRLTLSPEAADPSSGSLGFLMVGTQLVSLPSLMSWARLNGLEAEQEGALLVPAMPSGVYRLCTATADEVLLVQGGHAAPTLCTTGTLTVGGELHLER